MLLFSEIYEAKRWHDDPIYHTPMIIQQEKQIFIGDIVTTGSPETFAKVVMFLKEVHYM